MPGDVSDLDKNLALVDWLEYQLRQAKNRVRELKAKAEEEVRGRARAETSWVIQPQHTDQPAMLHGGSCTLATGKRVPITRAEAQVALGESYIVPCRMCRPEMGLTDG
ncbi:DUF6233 domain-containing protein [Streptomyces sp. NPDC088115]|uniref:DUF6233 domain-containing protein n=1 Tax=Streptomyces sp. NPDC088115 TaxID=3365824 RepID=UPI0037F79BE9